MLDSLEIRRDEQLRRRRSKRTRRQKNRRTNRAIIVVVGRNLRRRMRFGLSKRGALSACVRALRQSVQMDVAEGDHDLERQRDQRQHRAVSSMATNPTHPHQPSPTTMLALRVTFGKRRGSVAGLEPDQVTKKSASARSSWYVMSLRSTLARKLITRTLPGTYPFLRSMRSSDAPAGSCR